MGWALGGEVDFSRVLSSTLSISLQIRALSQVFRVPLLVYQAHCPTLTVGDEYQRAAESLCLS